MFKHPPPETILLSITLINPTCGKLATKLARSALFPADLAGKAGQTLTIESSTRKTFQWTADPTRRSFGRRADGHVWAGRAGIGKP